MMKTSFDKRVSGVEWIGEIPSHWTLHPLWSVSSHRTDKGTPNESDTKISPENVEGYTGRVSNYSSDYSGEGWTFIPNDILFNKLRTYLNKVFFCDRDGFSMGEMIVIRPQRINSKFLFYQLLNNVHVKYLDSFSTGVKQPRTDPYNVLHSKIPVPPLPEQQQIVSFLDEKTSLIDQEIGREESSIEYLKEFRQSLIHEVVTGKMDVRGVVTS